MLRFSRELPLMIKYIELVRRVAMAGIMLLLSFANYALANQPEHTTGILPDNQCDKAKLLTFKQLVAQHYRIGQILVNTQPIFDPDNPEENSLLYRWVNNFHFLTNEDVIRKDILFKSGDKINLAKIKETERLLRSRQYNWDAKITVVSTCADKVDLLVTTRDVWTLQPSISVGRAGGANKSSLAITDTNLLGSGKSIEISRFSNVDRTGYTFNYQDHDFLKNRWKLDVNYAKTSDGYRQFIQLHRPFYALDTRWEAGGNVFKSKLNNFLYSRGQVTDQFSHEISSFNFFGGTSKGYVNQQVSRYRYGFNYTEELFYQVPGIYANSQLPKDRIFSYPWIGYQYLQDKFQELTNVKQIGRTEDVNMGWRFNASLGYSSTTLGADINRWIISSSASKFMRDGFNNLWNWQINFRTNIAANKIENGLLTSTLKFYSRKSEWHSFYASGKISIAENLYKDVQLTLGGDTGLRGYPLRYQTGNRRYLLSLEERFYSNWEILKLFNVGGAIFVDAGRAWFTNKNNGLVDQGLLKDVGIGLRLSSTRAGHNRVIHIDLAKPIGATGEVKGLQWLVSLQSEF